MQYIWHLVSQVAIYAVLAESLAFLMRDIGRLSLAHAVFFGVGAYTTATLSVGLGWPMYATVVVAVAAATIAGSFLALLSARLESAYFVLLTFAVQLMFSAILVNAVAMTGGPIGVAGIPSPSLLGPDASRSSWAAVAVAIYLGVLATITSVSRSPLGRLMRAISEDSLLAVSQGKSVLGARLAALAIGCGIAGLAGAMQAHYQTYIDPSSFGAQVSLTLVAMVVMGGQTIGAGLIGAAVFVLLPEALRSAGATGGQVADLRQIAFGMVLIIVIVGGRLRSKRNE